MIKHELIGIALVSVMAISMLVIADAVKRIWNVPTELSRKIAHVGCGSVLMVLPIFVSTHWSVLVLSLSFAGIMAATYATGLLGGVHGVGRGLGGVLAYPIAAWLAYWLSFSVTGRGWVLYAISISILATADAAGALVGRRWGRHQYEVVDNHFRSLEGSAAVFGVAWICAAIVLATTGAATGLLLIIISTIAAVCAALLETVSVAGLDNLLIPFGTLHAVNHTLDMSIAQAAMQLVIIATCTVVVAAVSARRLSTVGGAVSVVLTGYLSWTAGGVEWLATFAVVVGAFALYERMTPMREQHTRSRYALGTIVTGLAVPVILASAAYLSTNAWVDGILYVAFISSLGCTAAILMYVMPEHHSFRLRRLRRAISTRHHWRYTPTVGKLIFATAGALAPMLIAQAIVAPPMINPAFAALWAYAGCATFVISASIWKCSHRMCPVCSSVDLLGMYCCQDMELTESSTSNPHGISTSVPLVATVAGTSLSVPRRAVSFTQNLLAANVAAATLAALGVAWLGM